MLFDVIFETTELAEAETVILEDWSAFDAKTLPTTWRFDRGLEVFTPTRRVELVTVRMFDKVVLAEMDAETLAD